MAGIFDTLAQVGRDTAGLGADAEKARRGAEAWQKAQALNAARVAAAAPPTGMMYAGGKMLGKAVGRFGPIAGLGAMGFGMADKMAEVQADPESRGAVERTLQVLSGADVTGFGGWVGRKLAGLPDPLPPMSSSAASAPATATPIGSTATPATMGPDFIPASGNGAEVDWLNSRDGAWAAPHGASPGIGAQLEAGPATTAVSSSRDANGNLVLTNAPPGPAGPGAEPQGFQAAPGSLASFFGAAMRQRQAGAQDKAAQAAALKLPEFMKTGAEASILSERMKLAAAETDPARKAAILAGHVMPEPKLQAPPNMQPLSGDKDQSGVVFDPAKGAFRKVPITQAATTANIDAALAGSMKGKTRAQVIQAYKDKGYDVSGVK